MLAVSMLLFLLLGDKSLIPWAVYSLSFLLDQSSFLAKRYPGIGLALPGILMMAVFPFDSVGFLAGLIALPSAASLAIFSIYRHRKEFTSNRLIPFSRSAKLHASKRLILKSIIGASAGVALAALFPALLRSMELIDLYKNGKSVSAQVINNEPGSPSPNGGGTLLYAYHIQNTAYTGKMDVPASTYARLRMGSVIPITYLPAYPAVHHIGRFHLQSFILELAEVIMIWVNVSLILPYIWLCLYLFYNHYISLAMYGRRLEGLISACRPIRRHGQITAYRLDYRFNTPAGSEYSGSARTQITIGEPTLAGFPIILLWNGKEPPEALPVSTILRYVEFLPDDNSIQMPHPARHR